MNYAKATELWESLHVGGSIRALLNLEEDNAGAKNWFTNAVQHIPANADWVVGDLVKRMLEHKLESYQNYDAGISKTVITVWQGKEFIREEA